MIKYQHLQFCDYLECYLEKHGYSDVPRFKNYLITVTKKPNTIGTPKLVIAERRAIRVVPCEKTVIFFELLPGAQPGDSKWVACRRLWWKNGLVYVTRDGYEEILGRIVSWRNSKISRG